MSKIDQLIKKTVKTTLKELNQEQTLNNQILNLKNRNMLLENNNNLLKAENRNLKSTFRQLKRRNTSLTKNNELLKQENNRLRLELENMKHYKLRVPNKTRHEVFKRDNYRCVECGATKAHTMLTIDHITPRSKGGSNDIDNLQVLCIKCNMEKDNASWKGGVTVSEEDEILGAIK